jgi:hypothetical protein
MPIPLALTALFTEAAGASASAGVAGAATGAGTAAAGTAASEGLGLAATSDLASAFKDALQQVGGLGGGGGPGGGGYTGYNLGGKVPTQLSGGLTNPASKIPGMGMIGKAIGAVQSKLYGVIEPLVTLPKALEDWGSSLIDSRRDLMAFNGVIAGAILETERRGILRKMKSGEAVSGSTANLGEALSDFMDEIQPIKDLIVNGFNTLAAGALKIATILAMIGRVAESVNDTITWMQNNWPFSSGKNDDERQEWVKFLDDIQAKGLREFQRDDDLMDPEGFDN